MNPRVAPLPLLLTAPALALLLAAPALAAGGVHEGAWCQSTALAIPDANASGVTSTLTIATGDTNSYVNILTVYLVIEHTYVSDLTVELTSPGGYSDTLIEHPGYPCPENNIGATFDDFAGPAANTMCDSTPRAIHGAVDPLDPFYLYTPQLLDGGWKLKVTDTSSTDTGTLRFWCILSGVVYYDGFETGDLLEWSAKQP